MFFQEKGRNGSSNRSNGRDPQNSGNDMVHSFAENQSPRSNSACYDSPRLVTRCIHIIILPTVLNSILNPPTPRYHAMIKITLNSILTIRGHPSFYSSSCIASTSTQHHHPYSPGSLPESQNTSSSFSVQLLQVLHSGIPS